MDDIATIISNVGFPIFTAVFLLVRIEPTLNRLEKTISKILFFMERNGHK